MRNLITNFRIYWKFLSRNKLYSFVSILGFSISLMFVILLSVYTKQELSADNFHEKKDRIYMMMHDNETYFGNPVAEFVKSKCPEVEAYTRIYNRDVQAGLSAKDRLSSPALYADSSFFNIFDFELIEGHPSAVLTQNNSVVLTESYANKIFGTSTQLVGKNIIIEENEFLITGLMKDIPKNTQLLEVDFIVNYASIAYLWGSERILTTNNNFGFSMYFLEKEGSNLPAKAEMLLPEFKENFWFYKSGFTNDLRFVKLQDAYFEIKETSYVRFRTNSRSLIMVYAGIAALILIVATMNYINMTVAQSSFRGKETAIKKLLGASRFSIINQILLESLLMMFITFSLGLFLAFLAQPYANNLLTANINILEHITPLTILVSISFVLLIAFISGIIPALIISNFNPLEVVKGGLQRKIKSSYSKILIVFQYTVAIGLLIASFFIYKQSNFMINRDTGFNRDHILIFNNRLEKSQLEGFKSKILGMNGVQNLSYSLGTPVLNSNNQSFEIDGEQFSIQEIVADDAFYEIYGITIKPTGVAESDETYFLNETGVRRLRMDTTNFTVKMNHKERSLIAGIINDFTTRSLHEELSIVRMRKIRDNEAAPWSISIKLDPNADAFPLVREIETAYADYLGGTKEEGKFVDERIQSWYEKEEKISKIISIFTILTILITIMGIFAMSLYLVKQKEKEIGVRKVNGATIAQMLWMLNLGSLKSVGIAFVLASPIAYYAINQWLQSFPYRIHISFIAFFLALVVIILLTLVSVSWMTWRAAKSNPIEILKSE